MHDKNGGGDVTCLRSSSRRSTGGSGGSVIGHTPFDMSINEEESAPSSDSFWEIGQYKRTVKRIDDGLSLCTNLMTLIKERGEIEAAYAKSLHVWGQKWAQQLEKGPEYGTTLEASKAVLEEAEERCKLHNRIRDRLTEEVFNTLKLWSKENYHQKPLIGIKESKEVEEAFRKAQKPWAKLYVKADKHRKEYHQACKAEKTAANQERNAQGDSSVSPDAAKKLAEKAEKCKEDCEKTKDAYEKSLTELTAYNGKYMEDTTMVFEKCQEMELKRLKFFKEMLFGIHKCLDISQNAKLPKIYKDYWATVEAADAQQDLRWWAQMFGTGMAMNWPVFEAYSEELQAISKHQAREKGKKEVANSTIQLKGVNAERFHKEFIEYSPEMRRIANPKKSAVDAQAQAVVLTKQRITDHHHNPQTTSTAPTTNGNSQSQKSGRPGDNGAKTPDGDGYSPFDEDDWDAGNDALVDDGRPGVKVKALYDYAPQESDELQLCKGDIFEKLEDEDDQGWCKGRIGNKVGLYPANYAAAI